MAKNNQEPSQSDDVEALKARIAELEAEAQIAYRAQHYNEGRVLRTSKTVSGSTREDR